MDAKNAPAMNTQKLRFHNTGREAITLFIEPWGDEFAIAPKSAIEIIASGPSGGTVEIDCDDGQITVYGWPGSTISVAQDGRILRGGGPPAPAVPPGTSVKGFVQGMFGQDHDRDVTK